MVSAGIDIGSRTVKLVLMRDRQIVEVRKAENSFNTHATCLSLLKDLDYDVITSTGYGRNFFHEHFQGQVISEIKAFAIGASFLHPDTRTILDIGGQDTKAISVDERGRLKKFEMNDKCAAGTGRFMEIMAMALRYTLDEFGVEALKADEAAQISSMCAVFAESEVISLTATGQSREKIAKGIHLSIVNRSLSLLRRVSDGKGLFFAGGVAYNPCIVDLLGKQSGQAVYVPEDPQIVGAVGAALHGFSEG